MISEQSNQLSSNGINRIVIYTDGGCHNGKDDPMYGIGSYAWLQPVDMSQGYVDVYGYYVTNTTNNKTEMMAVISAINDNINSNIHIISDSGYLVKGMNDPAYLDKWIANGWRLSNKEPVKNRELWEELKRLSWCTGIIFEMIKGHNKDKNITHAFWNDICDKACTHIMLHTPIENIRFKLRYDFNLKDFISAKKFYFTFGCGQYEGKYQVVMAYDSNEARAKMINVHGDKWAFQYAEEEWNIMRDDPHRFWPMESELKGVL